MARLARRCGVARIADYGPAKHRSAEVGTTTVHCATSGPHTVRTFRLEGARK